MSKQYYSSINSNQIYIYIYIHIIVKLPPLRVKTTFTESWKPPSDVWHRLRYIGAFR